LGDAPFTPAAGQGSRELEAAVEAAFSGDNGPAKLDTRALIVVRHGRIVAERYAPGFDAHSRFLGWSMSKSVTSAMIGALVGDGRLSLDGPSGVKEWQAPGDPRRAITLRNMLQMADGLAFDDKHVPGDETTMLYARADMAAYAATRPTLYPPGVKWSYSSGETLMIARLATETLGGGAEAQAYLRKKIFSPLHMDSAVLEADETGVPVGSSYVYATARDWARFGLLYLDDGLAPDHRRVLSHDWVAFSRTPNGLEPQGLYGAQFWVNRGPPGDPSLRMMKDLPTDSYFALGHSDEIVAIIPSRQTVIVRLGWTPDGQHFDANGVFSRILAALPSD
jgi:CubicO group peptidase (beta-lactamase class C family)